MCATPAFVRGQNIIGDATNSSTLGLNPMYKPTDKNEPDKSVEEAGFNLGIIQFTTAEKKLSFSQYQYRVGEESDFFFGVTGSAAIKNSLGSLFESSNVAPEGELSLRSGFSLYQSTEKWDDKLDGKRDKEEIQEILDNRTKPARDIWLVANASLKGSKFKLYNNDTTFENQVTDQRFTGIEVDLGVNYWEARLVELTVLAGATIGYEKKNNFDDLTEESFEENRTSSDSVSGANRKASEKLTVYKGKYTESEVFPLKIDLYFVPHKLDNVAVSVFSRTDFSLKVKPKTKMGTGIYFLKDQNAFNPVAGLVFEYSDIFNVDHSDDDKGSTSKFKISLTTRLAILGNRKME
jgi:hypothetical protein